MPIILHITADPVARERVARALGAGGYSTISARSGIEGVALAQSTPVDLVMVHGPFEDLDAYTVTLRLRGLPGWEDRPIVVVEEGEDAQMALAVGANGQLSPAAPPAHVVRSIVRYLRGDRERPDQSSEIRLRALSQRMATNIEEQMRSLRKANEDLEYLARIRSDFVRNVGHELATPITPALGYVQMLRSGHLGPLTSEQKSALDEVAAALDRLRQVTGVLRDVSAFETGQVRARHVRYTLEQLEDRISRDLLDRGLAATALPSFSVIDGAEGLDGDVKLLARAVEYLVDNAQKFGHEGVSIAIDLRLDGDVVLATVVDDGPGIASENLARLGELFHQVDGSSTRRHGGMGLGLAYARRVVEAHGGSVEILSPPTSRVFGMTWKGTEVRLRWKRRPDPSTITPT